MPTKRQVRRQNDLISACIERTHAVHNKAHGSNEAVDLHENSLKSRRSAF
jgi:hypothetical protein